jgi:hypothetical protein
VDSFTGFAEVVSALIFQMGLALWLEWFILSVLMRLMPPRQVERFERQTQSQTVELSLTELPLAHDVAVTRSNGENSARSGRTTRQSAFSPIHGRSEAFR